jgi:L-2,4-diaminobutyric acid acetyltransferase
MRIPVNQKLSTLRQPAARDGAALHALIRACPPLDENSIYCNLLQCTHFSATSIVAEGDQGLVAAISAYRVPAQQNTLFVWQVAVSKAARGQGLGRRMLSEILARPECSGVTHLETTVTASNKASWAMFKGFARRVGAALETTEMFEQSTHFAGRKPTEILLRIGPLHAPASCAAAPGSREVWKEMTA